jgi:lactoylglutathione lyase
VFLLPEEETNSLELSCLEWSCVQDVYKSAEQIKAAGGKITREPGPIPGINTKILATTDPDGWKYVLVDEEDFLNELK